MIVFDTPWLGPNVPQPPKWDSRDWDDVTVWIVDGHNAKAAGVDIATARQYGRDPGTPGDTRPGPWQSMHTAKIHLRHNQAGAPTAFFRRFRWVWKRSLIDGRDVQAMVEVTFGDAGSDSLGAPLLNWGTPLGLSSEPIPIDLDADTDYILEIDCVGHVRVRWYLPGADPLPDWSAPVPFTVGHGEPRSFLEMFHAGDTADVLLIDQIDISMGPPLGAPFFDIVIGYGDEVTDTYYGLPTVPGSVKWYVDGILTRPASVDEETGKVVFDRPVQQDSVVTQSGQGLGG